MADTVYCNGRWVPVSRAAINATTIGNNTIVTNPGGTKVIKVLHYIIVASADGTYAWESEDGTALSGAMPFSSSGGAAPPYCPVGQLATKVGQDLVLHVSAEAQGHVTYIIDEESTQFRYS
jgi:hypothetical protein